MVLYSLLSCIECTSKCDHSDGGVGARVGSSGEVKLFAPAIRVSKHVIVVLARD